ncbi:MAG: hypothetical protein J0H43_00410, partial [Actinobacteria bacterium]|nr:hypothetical protein [Actinomycetota bacterium]
VIAAHSGAGASSVALAIADAVAASGRLAGLVETAHPVRTGLVAAATAELGADPSGSWRRGLRCHIGGADITIARRASETAPDGWPALSDGVVVVDLGLPSPESLARVARSGCRVVAVCRPTVPGVRLMEQLLSALPTAPVVIAAVGGGRWPGEVSASLGPRLRALRASNAVVTVPTDRRLEVTGPTSSPLPKPVAAAGRSLLGLIDAAHPGDATASAQSAPRKRGITR